MKDKPKTLTPKLRFPEFAGEPGWTENPLAALLSPIVREREKPAKPYTGLGVRSHGKGTFLKPFEDPEKNSMEFLYEVHADDLIVNITFAWEGAIAIAQQIDNGALVSHRFPTYTFRQDAALPDFFRYLILDKQLIYKLGVISPGGAGRNRVLNKQDFLRLKRFVPSPPEQRKIAACLTSLDEWITADGRKLEALRAYKKGLMQQLFPREGETLPRLRFPEFCDAPGWEEKPFGDLYAFKPTNTLSRDKLNYEYGTIRNIHYGDIHTHFQTLFDISREVVPFVTNGSVDDFDDNALCAEGDMVFADASEDLDDVGKSIEIISLHGARVVSGTHTILATQRDAQLIVGFGGFLFRSERIRQQIRKESQGAKVYGISSGRLENVKVCFPAMEGEQRKIAACLTSLDECIASERRKLEALRAHKKGLMQQLFPSPEGV